MIVAVLLLTTQAVAQLPTSQAGDEQLSDTIVVVGRVPQDTAGPLERCLAAACPPKEDIALSLAHAQAQFVAGDYAGSRRTLTRARGRNRRFAAQLPQEVSNLHRANSRIADLIGLVDESRKGVFDIIDALKAGLNKEDERVMLARLEAGSVFARQGRIRFAFEEYRAVEKFASRSGNRPLQGLALFQRAVLLAVIASNDSEVAPAARRVAAQITGSDEPTWQPFRDAVRMVPVMLAPKNKRAALVDQVARSMEPRPASSLLLLYAPAVDLGDTASLPGEKTEWMDLRFTVARDGTARDVTPLGGSDRVKDAWVQAAITALRQRRYAPLSLRADEAEPQRTERISFVSDLLIEWNTRSFGRATDRRAVVQSLNGRTLGDR